MRNAIAPALTVALLIFGLSACGGDPAPSPSPVESPLSEDEKFRELAAMKTDGIIAQQLVQSIAPESLINIRTNVIEAVEGGMSVDEAINIGANSFQKQGHDRDVAIKMSEGITEASLLWNAKKSP